MTALEIKANEVPAIRVAIAVANKVNKNLLFVVSGGLGDRVAAEPTLRYALNKFPHCRISLCCDTPELFRHLEFETIYRNWMSVPANKYLEIYSYPEGGLAGQFMCPNLMNSVDLASVCALRATLPNSDKQVVLKPRIPQNEGIEIIVRNPGAVVVHPGKTWPSRTFPAQWWRQVIDGIMEKGLTPILIGNSTVEIKGIGGWNKSIVNLRDSLSLNDYLWVCQNASAIVTNDSSPLHIASSGFGKIVFVPTCRDPELLYHWRAGCFRWNMYAVVGKKRMWEQFEACPNTLEGSDTSLIPSGNILDYLPTPHQVVDAI